MERESKRKKVNSEEQQSPKIKMAQNLNTRSSPLCIAASSRNNSEASTSPILDTTKVRRKGKFYTRRTVSDSVCSSSLPKVTKYQKIQQTSITTDNNKNLETSSESKELAKCLNCDSMLDTNKKCLNCSDEKLASPRNNCLNESLGHRVRNLKHLKKSATRISDVKDMQIKDEEFVESIRKLDKASYLSPPKNNSLSPTKRLGLLPFVERLRLSQMQEQKSTHFVSHSPKKTLELLPFVELEQLRFSQMKTERNSLPAIHLSLDEDKEEDGDMFADTKDNVEVLEDLEEFFPRKYNCIDTSTSSFHGFSLQECNSSRDIAEKGSQFQELNEVVFLDEITHFCGFPAENTDKSENLLQDWKSSLRNNILDSKDWEDWFVEAATENQGNLKDTQDDKVEFVSDKVRENIAFLADSKENMAGSEKISKLFNQKLESRTKCGSETATPKVDTPLSKDIKDATESRRNCNLNDSPKSTSSSKLENLPGPSKFSTVCTRPSKMFETAVDKITVKDKRQQITKRQYFEVDEAKKISESPPKKKTKDMKNECSVDLGFTIAGGRELKISEASWSKSKAVFDAIEEPCIANLAEKEKDSDSVGQNESKINVGFTTAGGRELKVSEASWSKSKAVFDAIEEPCIANLAEKEKDSDSVGKNESKINVGFTTAGGRELKVSEASWSKSKAVFDAIEEPCIANLAEKEKDSDSVCKNESKINVGFTTAGGRELKVSEASWSKSKAVFDAIEESCLADLAEKEKDSNSVCKNESKINVCFTTAGGCELKVSEASWSKSKAVFDAIEEPCLANLAEKEKDSDSVGKNESKINVGFTTAGGRELKVSEASWSKSKAVFDAIEEPCIANLAEKEKDSDSVCKNESKINVGFTTAGGCELKVSEASWSKSKAVFDAIEEPCIANLAEKEKDSDSVCKNESKINVGFTTAGGRELKVSEASWSKSKAVFDAIEEPSIADLAEKNKDASLETNTIASRSKTETMTSGFSTASGHSINVTTEAISAAKAQFSSDWDNMESLDLEGFVDPIEEPEISKKRKVEDIDEETPLRRDSSLKRKRGRYVNDLQARKLFIEESNNEDEHKRTNPSSEFVGLNRVNTEKNLISEEVDASAAALLEDEERSNDGATWKISALTKDRSVSPELGSEINNRSRADVSTRNLLGALNRAKLEKVNIVETSGDSRFSHAATGASINNEEHNHRAASTEKREESQEIQHESIPDDLTFDSQFSQDIQRSPVIDKFIADTMKIMEGRLAMALKQDEAIRAKRRIKPEANDGFLYRIRTSNRDSRISWKQLTEGIAPSSREISGDSLGRDLMSVTAKSAAHYSFRCADFYGEGVVRSNIEGIKVGDGALLILDEKNSAGAREFERAFLASPGINPNLIPTGWLKNHYRWIVWKLASMDRVKFGHKILPRMLTPDRVMHELKYRYDREIHRTQWPPLRKMLERAEDISGRIVLCVSSIITEKDENAPVKAANTPNSISPTFYKMTLTDGWYSIGTSIDSAMINFIKSGKVREGTKLMIFGARAVNLDQGCSALEIPEAVTLRISSNSTRRAKWNAKLDFYRANRGPMSLSLKSIKPNGGTICKLIVAVSRVYPILYREKLPDGQFVFRNARCDEEAARDHEARYQSKMEEIYANAWSEFQISSMSRKSSGSAKKRSYTEEEVAACSKDMEEEWRQRISSKMSECLPTPRDVTPVMKIRIAEDDTCALMTVWSTDRDTSEIFVEGSSIAIYNSFASGLRSSELQITASRCTFVKREESRQISYPERIYTSLTGITDPGFNPVYGEFDTIGIVSSTGPAPHGMKNFETVNFACPKPDDGNESDFLSVLFWQGVSAHGYAKILTVGSLVACSNLEWRRNTSRGIPTAYCTERSVFSKNPRQSHLTHAFENLRKEIKEPLTYAAACATVIEEEIARKSALRTPGSVSGTPYRPATSNSRTPGWSPRDLTIDANCNTPRIDSKKSSTRKRLERLESYGEAPALPSIVINNSSRKVLSEFRSPVTKP